LEWRPRELWPIVQNPWRGSRPLRFPCLTKPNQTTTIQWKR
jgi:hypothetical protein